MKEFISYIIGDLSVAHFAAILFFAYLTAFAMLMISTTKRDVSSARTPAQFSWSFFWSDNTKRIAGNLILIFLSVRILQYWIKADNMIYWSIAIGVIADQLAILFQSVSGPIVAFIKKHLDSLFGQ